MFHLQKTNNIQVLFIDVDSPSVCVKILVKAWTYYETRNINWISHFLEHMFFKWSKKYPSAKIQAMTIEEVWWEINAFTSENYTWYYVKIAKDYVLTGVDLLVDMIANPLFPENEIEKERGVIIQEIMMYEDTPSKLVHNKWDSYFFWDNPYGRPILWPVENIQKITAEDLFKYKNSLYTKDNILVVISWKIDKNTKKQILDIIWNNLYIPEKKKIKKAVFKKNLPSKKEDFFSKKTEQNHIISWVYSVNMFSEERFAWNIIWSLFWWNMSSRLFQALREEKWLCYYVYAANSTKEDFGIFFIWAWLDKKNFKEGKKAIFDEINKLYKNWITKEEYTKTIWYINWKIAMWLETVEDIASFYGKQYFFKKELLIPNDFKEKYNQITPNQINDIIKNNILTDNFYTFWIE